MVGKWKVTWGPPGRNTAFWFVLLKLNFLGDKTCKAIKYAAAASGHAGKLFFQILAAYSLILCATHWGMSMDSNPGVDLLIVSCLGILGANLAEVAAGEREILCAVKYPLSVAAILFLLVHTYAP